MSHNTVSDFPVALRAGASWRPLVFVSINNGDSNVSLPVAHSWRAVTSDMVVSLPTGWSWVTGPNAKVLPQFQSQWKDSINVPSGEWLVEFKVAMSTTATYTGRIALFDSSGAQLSPIVSYRDANRSCAIIARVVGPVQVVLNVVQTTVNTQANSNAYRTASFSFYQIG